MIESTITKKGQTTLPKAVRESLGVQAGDRVRYIISDSEVRILPIRPVSRLFGVLHYEGAVVTVEEMHEAVADSAASE
ncbi:MAG: type II toxin-antitoxin system PrlF family antitoxin [Gammaproteobacteria bacterium]|nr:type II toxin-antitoxin system PrlF family antitoxin [Gammaproteobacteria bacterium]